MNKKIEKSNWNLCVDGCGFGHFLPINSFFLLQMANNNKIDPSKRNEDYPSFCLQYSIIHFPKVSIFQDCCIFVLFMFSNVQNEAMMQFFLP